VPTVTEHDEETKPEAAREKQDLDPIRREEREEQRELEERELLRAAISAWGHP
jgi:hypothetical protein